MVQAPGEDGKVKIKWAHDGSEAEVGEKQTIGSLVGKLGGWGGLFGRSAGR